jgi:hypothetical protein
MYQDAAKTVAIRDKQRNRRDPPNHAEHGEETACHVTLQCVPSFDNDFEEHDVLPGSFKFSSFQVSKTEQASTLKLRNSETLKP